MAGATKRTQTGRPQRQAASSQARRTTTVEDGGAGLPLGPFGWE